MCFLIWQLQLQYLFEIAKSRHGPMIRKHIKSHGLGVIHSYFRILHVLNIGAGRYLRNILVARYLSCRYPISAL